MAARYQVAIFISFTIVSIMYSNSKAVFS